MISKIVFSKGSLGKLLTYMGINFLVFRKKMIENIISKVISNPKGLHF